MFALIPWREGNGTRALLPRLETPFRLLEEFEPIMERFFGSWPTPVEEWEPTYRGFHLTETEKEYLVRAELPGFEPPEVAVTLLGNVLTIEAKHGEEPREGEPEVKDRRYAHVKRAISLPEGVELEKLEAAYRNGVLEVHLPKAPEAVARRIEVKT
jgi:HSP20 family protein